MRGGPAFACQPAKAGRKQPGKLSSQVTHAARPRPYYQPFRSPRLRALSVPMENPEPTANPAAAETGNPGQANSVLKIQSLTGRAIVAAFILLVLFYLLNILHPFFAALAWAAILATALHPVYLRIQQHIRRPRLASALTCLLQIGRAHV